METRNIKLDNITWIRVFVPRKDITKENTIGSNSKNYIKEFWCFRPDYFSPQIEIRFICPYCGNPICFREHISRSILFTETVDSVLCYKCYYRMVFAEEVFSRILQALGFAGKDTLSIMWEIYPNFCCEKILKRLPADVWSRGDMVLANDKSHTSL